MDQPSAQFGHYWKAARSRPVDEDLAEGFAAAVCTCMAISLHHRTRTGLSPQEQSPHMPATLTVVLSGLAAGCTTKESFKRAVTETPPL